MMETAVRPIAMPPRTRPSRPLTSCNRTPKTHAETMNMPKAAASIRYSGQCDARASIAPERLVTAGIAACTRLKDAARAKYSAEYKKLPGGYTSDHATDNGFPLTPVRSDCGQCPLVAPGA